MTKDEALKPWFTIAELNAWADKNLAENPHWVMPTEEPERAWVRLTDEEIWKTISRIGTSDSDVNPHAKLADARAIEAKLRSKNT